MAVPEEGVRFSEGTAEDAETKQSYYTCEWLPQADARALLFVVHGLHEHIGRYRVLGEFFARRGVAVFGCDLPAHGRTMPDPAARGLIADFDPVAWLVSRRVHAISQGRFGGKLPAFLFGHSMGSLVAFACLRRLASVPTPLVGFAVTGMCAPTPNVFLRAASVVVAAVAPSAAIAPLPLTGLTVDTAVQDAYLRDPLNKIGGVEARTARAMVAATVENFAYARQIDATDAALPMLFMHGSEDTLCPLTEAKALFEALPKALRDSGRAEMRVFNGFRHEILNDTCGDDVREHLLHWMEAILAKQPVPAPPATTAATTVSEVAAPAEESS